MTAGVEPWKKWEVRKMQGALTAFVVSQRLYRTVEWMRAAVEGHRQEIVRAETESLRRIFADRADSNLKASEHFRLHPEVYGDSTPEMVKRFADLAAGDFAAESRLLRLLDRLEVLGLPDEVVAFDPLGKVAA